MTSPPRMLVEILKMGRPDLFRSAMRIHLQYWLG